MKNARVKTFIAFLGGHPRFLQAHTTRSPRSPTQQKLKVASRATVPEVTEVAAPDF